MSAQRHMAARDGCAPTVRRMRSRQRHGLQVPVLIGWLLGCGAAAGVAAATDEELGILPEHQGLPNSSLSLTLRGLVALPEQEISRAIIAGPDGRQITYAVADAVPGEAVIAHIYGDRLILQRGGALETLRLPKEPLGQHAGLVRAEPKEIPVERRTVDDWKPPPVPGEGGLREYRDRLLINPDSMRNLVQFTPVISGGQLQGYRLTPGMKPELMSRYGFMAGDVVTSVNGVKIDPANVNDIIQSVALANDLSVTVRRRGREQSITLNLNE